MPPLNPGELTVIGWREWVALPALGIARLRAKVDTGARTTALDAAEIAIDRDEQGEWVSFCLPHDSGRRCRHPLHRLRRIRNTGGEPELRPTILSELVMGTRRWPIEISLTRRRGMLNPLILGRTAVRGRGLAVYPGRSFFLGDPQP